MVQIFRLPFSLRLFSKIFLILVLLESLIACSKMGSFQSLTQSSDLAGGQNTPTENPPPNPAYAPEPLSWEAPSHPERVVWSAGLAKIVETYFSVLDQANDISRFCPKYSTLTVDQKINLWSDLFAATSYFESGYDPASNSVDVGSANDPNSWSVGLLQMSVVDQPNYNLSFGYSFSDLQDPLKNLRLGVAIMSAQIKKYGTVLIATGNPGLYWATLHPGGKYDQSSAIEADTKQLSFCRP